MNPGVSAATWLLLGGVAVVRALAPTRKQVMARRLATANLEASLEALGRERARHPLAVAVGDQLRLKLLRSGLKQAHNVAVRRAARSARDPVPDVRGMR
jgi:hypothetical protein